MEWLFSLLTLGLFELFLKRWKHSESNGTGLIIILASVTIAFLFSACSVCVESLPLEQADVTLEKP
ncbi:hypothetical protein [Metaplanococcus flavidus]|uniref:hypothetical protein n=1 Tax=Metaplanococcus flavidus TaxID=569883 RepID=UPI0011953D58